MGDALVHVIGVCAAAALVLFVLCTLVLTPTALFSDHWASETRTYQHIAGTTTVWNGVNGTARIFVMIAFVFILLPFKCASCFSCSDDRKSNIAWLFSICCTISAFFSFIGCLIHAGQFATSQLGYSFYLGLTPGLLLLVIIFLGVLLFVSLWCISECDSIGTCCKVEPVSHGPNPEDGQNDTNVFTITSSSGQFSGQPPAYNEVPGLLSKPAKGT